MTARRAAALAEARALRVPEVEPRLPLEPLSIVMLAKVCRVSRRKVYAWRARGVPLFEADAAALRCGLWPGAVWPEFHEVAS
jgi:hypothetical protein